MLRYPITYTNFNGDKVTETFHFHLSRPEVVQLEASIDGGLSGTLKAIVDSEDIRKIIEYFKIIILTSYGEKSDDGRHFRKSPEMARDFEQSAAFDELYMTLAGNAEKAAAFVQGILPKMEDQDKPSFPPPTPKDQ